MKKLIYKIMLINLLMVFSLSTNLFAGRDTHSIRVSCTIPEVPGLNAPLMEELSYKTTNTWSSKENIQEHRTAEKPQLLQQETGYNIYTFYAL